MLKMLEWVYKSESDAKTLGRVIALTMACALVATLNFKGYQSIGDAYPNLRRLIMIVVAIAFVGRILLWIAKDDPETDSQGESVDEALSAKVSSEEALNSVSNKRRNRLAGLFICDSLLALGALVMLTVIAVSINAIATGAQSGETVELLWTGIHFTARETAMTFVAGVALAVIGFLIGEEFEEYK